MENTNLHQGNLPSFDFDWDDQHNKVYRDENVQKVYVQLKTLSSFIGDCQIKSELEYSNIAINIDVKADAPIKTTADYLIDLLKYGFEKIADVEFPFFGTMGGKVVSYLLTGLVDKWTEKEYRPDTLMDTYNIVWEGTKAAFDSAKLCVDQWHDDMEKYWTTPYTYNNNTAYISDLANIDYLPTKDNQLTEYDNATIFVASKTKYMMTMKMLASKWKFKYIDSDSCYNEYYTRWNDKEEWNGPHWQNDRATPNGGTTGNQYYFKLYQGPLEHYFWYYNGGQPAYEDRPAKNYTIFRGSKNPIVGFNDAYDIDSYVHNWFTDDEKWVGWRFKRYELQDFNGGTAPESLTDFLFKDDYTGGESNTRGLTTRQDVFENWGIAELNNQTTKPFKPSLIVKLKQLFKKIYKKRVN